MLDLLKLLLYLHDLAMNWYTFIFILISYNCVVVAAAAAADLLLLHILNF